MTCHVMLARAEYYALGSWSCFYLVLRSSGAKATVSLLLPTVEIPRDTPSQRAAVLCPVRVRLGLLLRPFLKA